LACGRSRPRHRRNSAAANTLRRRQAQEAAREEKEHLTGLRKRLHLLAQPPPPPPPPPPAPLPGAAGMGLGAAAAASSSFARAAESASPGDRTRLDRCIAEYLLREVCSVCWWMCRRGGKRAFAFSVPSCLSLSPVLFPIFFCALLKRAAWAWRSRHVVPSPVRHRCGCSFDCTTTAATKSALTTVQTPPPLPAGLASYFPVKFLTVVHEGALRGCA